jgi:hypothetical protein
MAARIGQARKLQEAGGKESESKYEDESSMFPRNVAGLLPY